MTLLFPRRLTGFLLLAAVLGRADVVTLDYRQTSISEITSQERDHQLFVSAQELFTPFNGHSVWSPDKRKLVVALNGTDVFLTENNPYLQVGDSAINLIAPPFLDNGELFVPAAGIAEVKPSRSSAATGSSERRSARKKRTAHSIRFFSRIPWASITPISSPS